MGDNTADPRRRVRIFLAAPAADTEALRAVVEDEVQRVADSQLVNRLLQVELVRWNDPRHPIPMSWLRPPQEAVNAYTGGPSSCDLVIGLFRHVFGSTLEPERFGTRPDGTRWACTEWELHTAVQEANRANGLVRDVWVFRDVTPLRLAKRTDEQREADAAELARVHAFCKTVSRAGSKDRGLHEFEGADELRMMFPGLLDAWLHQYLTAAQEAESARLATPPAPRGPVPATTAPAPISLADLQPFLTRRAETWRSQAAGQLDRRFVNLTLMVDRGLDHPGPRHEIDARHRPDGHYELLAELLAERPDVDAWVLVGLPGSGKSTVLQHHEMGTADVALQLLAQRQDLPHEPGSGKPEVCIWHRLSEYSADSPAPADWLTLPARWPSDLPPLDQLRQVARVRFLLDGLNEIKAPDRARQLRAIDRWTAWAAAEAAQPEHLAPIFSVRTLDQCPMSDGSFEVRQIVLAPWQDKQIQAYCAHTLPEGDANTLWPSLSQAPDLLALARLPFNLAAQCSLYRALGRPASDRAELMGGLVWQMLAKRQGDPALRKPGLLGADDWQRVINGSWTQSLRGLPERAGCLVPWLDEALQRLQRRGRQVSVTRDELLADLPNRPGWASPEDWLHAVRSLQLLDEGGHDEYSADPLLRCTHQLWQEFFAARGIRDWAARSPERLPDLSPPPLEDLATTQARLGLQEPMPGPDPTHWEEPVKLAVQLVRDPAPWITHLQPHNLALAGRAALACRARLSEATLAPLRQALLARSRDGAVDVRLRIEAGLILGELGDPRYEERQGPHGRYLWPRQWATVPGGRYRIGDDSSGQPDEKPETEVALAPFELAFAPVTNAEYRCFMDAGGYEDERWWVGETAQRWRREGIRNEQSIQEWTTWIAALREDFDDGVQRYFSGYTPANVENLRVYAALSADEAHDILERQFGGKIEREPGVWQNTSFNAPNQPVVGVSLYEAQAYAHWLAAQSGRPCRLPAEAEWEAAARGDARHTWPWGEADPEPGQLNADPTHLRRTSPVGVFPAGDSPGGLSDLAGNVWEWTVSAHTEALDAGELVDTAPDGPARRAVRGGSWGRPADHCRAAYRVRFTPVVRFINLGFRVCW